MRKFTSLMLMLLCAVTTAWAGPTDLPQITTDVNNPIYYTIYNTRSSQPGGLMYYAGDNVGLKDGCTSATLEDKYKFYFTGSHEALYIHNAATTNKLASVGSWTAEGTVWAVAVSPKGGGLAFGPKGGLNGNDCWNEKNYATNETTSDFTTWSANDAGSIFVVELASECTFPVSDLFYTIEAPLFENVQGVNKGLIVNADGSLGWNTVDLTNKNCYWIPTVNADGTVALKNVGTNQYINGTNMSADVVNGTIKALGSNQFNLVFNGTTMHANDHNGGANPNGNIVSWGGAVGSASAWKFVERQDPDDATEITITYSFIYNGVEKLTQETTTLVGEEYPAITVALPFGVKATKPAGTIAADAATTVEIVLENTLPFVAAADYESINKWYFLIFHANHRNYLYYNGTENVLDASKTTYDLANENAYSWAFIGDPFTGFSIVNKAAGEGKSLNAGTDGAVISNAGHIFAITASSHGENGFFMASTNSDKKDRFNKQGGKVVYWSGADAGSTFMVRDIDEAKAAIVEEFKNNALASLGYVGGYAADKADEIEAIATLDDINAFKSANTTMAFEAGAYYRIQNVYRTTYATISGTDRVLAKLNNGSAAQLWQVEAGTAEGTYSIKNVNAAAYMQVPGNNVLGEKADLKINSLEEGIGQFCIQDPANNNQLAGINATTFGTWWNAAVGSDLAYRFIPVTELEVSINEFASVCLPFAVEVEGATAYAVESVEAGFVTLEKKDDIPAGEGAILAGNGTATLTIADAATSNWTNNKLEGTTVDSYIAPAGTAYVLGKVEGEVGLYKAKLNKKEDGTAAAEGEAGTHFLNNANKAYLVVANANPAAQYSFRFGEGTTGIENVESAEAVKAIFDLTGRRVEAVTAPGIYIVNGKKVLVK